MNDNLNLGTTSTSERLPAYSQETFPTDSAIRLFKEYARERPEVVALWCLGIGFVLGWKLKPW